MKPRRLHLNIPIYKNEVFFIIAGSKEWYKLNKKLEFDFEIDDFRANAQTVSMPNKNKNAIYCLVKPNSVNYNTVCHELIHIVGYICDLNNVKTDPDNNEAAAYLSGYVGKKIFKFCFGKEKK